MGYDLHITRKKFWIDANGSQITSQDWLSYIANDPQLRLRPDSKDHTATILIESEYPEPWLSWSDGNIYTKNPDLPILAKMLQIASALGAKVQGDDGEVYRSANFEDAVQEE